MSMFDRLKPLTNEFVNYRHAKFLHESLLEIFNRIDAVKQEHDKLDNNNKFLQKYIGDLMSTSKITASGSSGRKK
jgi:short coiled-coil protein